MINENEKSSKYYTMAANAGIDKNNYSIYNQLVPMKEGRYFYRYLIFDDKNGCQIYTDKDYLNGKERPAAAKDIK